jgi:hypothetical protein
MRGFGFPLDPNSHTAEEKAGFAGLAASVLRVLDAMPPTPSAKKEEIIEQLRLMAKMLPDLWADGKLPKPVAELVRRFGPEAG